MANSSQAPKHLEKMENEANLEVTFANKRDDLFKKASELCTLTGSELGIIVFSPKREMFSFGHPSVHKVMENCFPEEGGEGTSAIGNIFLNPYTAARVMEPNRQLKEEKQRQVELEKKLKASGDKPVKEMTESELVELRERVSALKQKVMSMEGYGRVSIPSL